MSLSTSPPPSIPSRHPSLPAYVHPRFTLSHFTGNASACWCIIPNLQIMSPLSLPFSVNNLSKTSWVTFASECCQSRFPLSLLKRPGEEALQSNDLDDWVDQMWTDTLGSSLYCSVFSNLCFFFFFFSFIFERLVFGDREVLHKQLLS